MTARKYMKRVGDTFVKYHGPPIDDDWIRVNALAELTAKVAELQTAKPVAINASQQQIVYTWLGNLPRMISLPHERLLHAAVQLGAGLAEIHRQGRNCTALSSIAHLERISLKEFGIDDALQAQVDSLIPTGFFHGDCWHANVLVGTDGKLVLIDPIQSPWLFGQQRFFLASGIADLATLHMSLIVSYRLHDLVRVNVDQRLEVGEKLIQSYLGQFDATALRGAVLKLSRAIAIRYISSYPTRINFLVGKVKQVLSQRKIETIDKILDWQ